MNTSDTHLPDSDLSNYLEDIKVRTLTKAELRKRLCRDLGLSPEKAGDIVNGFFDLIIQTLNAGQDVKLAGFGKFSVKTRKARPGRNVKTGEAVQIETRRSVTFTMGPKQKELMVPRRAKRKKMPKRFGQALHYATGHATAGAPGQQQIPLLRETSSRMVVTQ